MGLGAGGGGVWGIKHALCGFFRKNDLSFEKAFYFGNMNISKVIPVYKDKGNILDSSNYRPISLLSNINKIIEKLMYERLFYFSLFQNVIK